MGVMMAGSGPAPNRGEPGRWLGIGVALGVAFGVPLDSIPIGIVLGLCLGLVIGRAREGRADA